MMAVMRDGHAYPPRRKLFVEVSVLLVSLHSDPPLNVVLSRLLPPKNMSRHLLSPPSWWEDKTRKVVYYPCNLFTNLFIQLLTVAMANGTRNFSFLVFTMTMFAFSWQGLVSTWPPCHFLKTIATSYAQNVQAQSLE